MDYKKLDILTNLWLEIDNARVNTQQNSDDVEVKLELLDDIKQWEKEIDVKPYNKSKLFLILWSDFEDAQIKAERKADQYDDDMKIAEMLWNDVDKWDRKLSQQIKNLQPQ